MQPSQARTCNFISQGTRRAATSRVIASRRALSLPTRSLLTALLLLALTQNAPAEVLYGNFTAQTTYQGQGGYTVAYPSPDYASGQTQAYRFVPDDDYWLTSVDLPVRSICPECAGNFAVAIYADHQDQPSTLIELARGTAAYGNYWELVYPVNHLRFSGAARLTAGTAYWVCVHPDPADINGEDLGWAWASPVIYSESWGSASRQRLLPGTGWEWYEPTRKESAYRINGVPVSAPPKCAGNCNGDGAVTVDEILILVNIATGGAQPATCAAGIPPGDSVDIGLIIQAVNHALSGCTDT